MSQFRFQKKTYFISFGIGALILAVAIFLLPSVISERPLEVPVKTADSPSVSPSAEPEDILSKKRPLPHLSPQETYDYDSNLEVRNAKNALPNIEIVTEISQAFVRPRKNRQIKMEASEPEVLVVLYASYPERALDMCLTPCSLNAEASETYHISAYKHGFARQFRGVDTALTPSEEVITIPIGTNWLETYERQKSCFAENEARLSEDRDAESCVRNPPIPPQPAPKSGHCRMKFTVTKTGYTTDVQALNCSIDFFKAAAIHNVRTWYYFPKIENGEFVDRPNVRAKITFKILDEEGVLLPE